MVHFQDYKEPMDSNYDVYPTTTNDNIKEPFLDINEQLDSNYDKEDNKIDPGDSSPFFQYYL